MQKCHRVSEPSFNLKSVTDGVVCSESKCDEEPKSDCLTSCDPFRKTMSSNTNKPDVPSDPNLKRKRDCFMKENQELQAGCEERSTAEDGKVLAFWPLSTRSSLTRAAYVEHQEVENRFVEDISKVSIHDFGTRVATVLWQMCLSNDDARPDFEDNGALRNLVYDEYGRDDVLQLVRNLLAWDDTSRSVGIVALVLMDRIQTCPKGFAVNFDNIGKVFAICFLLAKKTLDDYEL